MSPAASGRRRVTVALASSLQRLSTQSIEPANKRYAPASTISASTARVAENAVWVVQTSVAVGRPSYVALATIPVPAYTVATSPAWEPETVRESVEDCARAVAPRVTSRRVCGVDALTATCEPPDW